MGGFEVKVEVGLKVSDYRANLKKKKKLESRVRDALVLLASLVPQIYISATTFV